jgi:hypothetical protein
VGRRPIPKGREAPYLWRDPRQPAPSAGCGAVARPLRTARVGPRITPSQSAHSPQSPQKVRNSATIGRRRPTASDDEAAGNPGVPSITTRRRASRVRSGSTSPAGCSSPGVAAVAQLRRSSLRVSWPTLVEQMLRTSGRRIDMSQPFVDAMMPRRGRGCTWSSPCPLGKQARRHDRSPFRSSCGL